jgi:hypothetical protein
MGVFPTGGTVPWVDIADYQIGGVSFGPDKQGLSWSFQILPYMELEATHNIKNLSQLVQTPVIAYFCPLRRGVTWFG